MDVVHSRDDVVCECMCVSTNECVLNRLRVRVSEVK